MNGIWSSIKDYLNIEPDPEVAKRENHKAVKLILTAGLLNSLLLIALEKALYGHIRSEMFIGCGLFAFLLAFSFMNWYVLKNHITGEMEIFIFVIMVLIAFVDYNPGVKVSAFLFPILLVVLPPMIFVVNIKVMNGSEFLSFCPLPMWQTSDNSTSSPLSSLISRTAASKIVSPASR